MDDWGKLVAIKMDLLNVYKDMVKRVPLVTLQLTFKRFDIRAGQSVKGTISKVEKMLHKEKPEDLAALQKIKNWYLNDHILHGEKGVYFCKPHKNTPDLIKLLSTVKPEKSRYLNAFPLTLGTDALDKNDCDSYLVDIIDYKGGLALTFSTVRFYAKRFSVPVSRLKDDAIIEYGSPDDLTATSYEYDQLFDIIVIRPDGMIEIRVDNPQMGDGKLVPGSERQAAYVNIRKKFYDLVKQKLGREWVFLEAINLIEVIDSIYNANNEGFVRLLSFTTANSGAKTVKADHTKPDDCCRVDTYHSAGSKAVQGDINPYRMHMCWNEDDTGPGELRVLGTVNCLEKGNNPFHEAIITRTLKQTHYDFICDRILAHA